eukprot:scaffold1386_cov380-Prasinococcus_capsulatus_cf.AAC.1
MGARGPWPVLDWGLIAQSAGGARRADEHGGGRQFELLWAEGGRLEPENEMYILWASGTSLEERPG